MLDFGSDPRIRSFPFTTGRPTLEELKRAWEELSTVKIELQCMESVSMKEIDQETLPVAPAPTVTKLPIEKLSLEQPSQEPSQEFTKASDLIRRGKVDLLNAVLQGYPALLAESTVDGNTLLHLAAAQSQPDIVLALLQLGSDASLKNSRKQTPYQSATAKPTRDVFRRFIADVTPTWDWKEAMIPGPLTKEMEESQKAKEKEKRRKNKEKSAASKKNNREEEEVEAPPSPSTTKKKGKNSLGLLSSTDLQSIGVSQERRKLLDREKRALAAEARVRSAARQCAACGKPMEGTIGFDKGGFKYCSMDCVKAHIGLHDPV